MEPSNKMMLMKTRGCARRRCQGHPHVNRYVGMKPDGSFLKLPIPLSEVKQVKAKGSHKVIVLDVGELNQIPKKYWPNKLEYDPTKPVKTAFEEYFKKTIPPSMLPPGLRSTAAGEGPSVSEGDGVVDDAEDAESHASG